MPKTSIIFRDDVFNRLKKNAAERKISLAYHIRNLVSIGLQVEEASLRKEYDDNSDKNNREQNNLKIIWENNLSWSLESVQLLRYLIRYLIHAENLSQEANKDYIDSIISTAKEKAQTYVKGLLQEEI
jgi:hypothetical protein